MAVVPSPWVAAPSIRVLRLVNCPRNSAELICELAADNAGSYGIVWFFLSAMFYAEVKGFARRKSEGYRLTTQAQRPGAPDATIATTTLPPGSLQRMVRPHFHD